MQQKHRIHIEISRLGRGEATGAGVAALVILVVLIVLALYSPLSREIMSHTLWPSYTISRSCQSVVKRGEMKSVRSFQPGFRPMLA